MEQLKLQTALTKTISPNKVRETLLDSDFMSDVTFLLGPDETPLKAHKLFLMTSSPVLNKLLMENNEEQLNIKIQQFSKSIMLEICRYAYTDDIKLSSENMLDILFAASKFQMRFLMEKTIDYICREMSDETVFKILATNQKYHNMRINMNCLEYIEKNHRKCFENVDFLKISDEILRTIITTCKIPAQSCKKAIEKWSISNDFNDLDELMGLISLKNTDDVPNSETNNQKSEVKNSSGSERRRDNRPHNRDRSRQNRSVQSQQQNIANFMLPTSQLLQKMGTKSFVLYGNITRKNFKYANLDFITSTPNIRLHSIQFIYDLKTTDSEFEISVILVDGNQRRHIYDNKVIIDATSIEAYLLYEFSRDVLVPAGQKMWIRIEFSKQEYRRTFDHFDVTPRSIGTELQVRRDTAVNSYAQIIQAIFYYNM